MRGITKNYLDILNDINDERLRSDFQAATERLNENYRPRMLEYIRQHHPELYTRTEEAEAVLNEEWIRVRDNGAGTEGFYALLEEWEGLMHQWMEAARGGSSQ